MWSTEPHCHWWLIEAAHLAYGHQGSWVHGLQHRAHERRPRPAFAHWQTMLMNSHSQQNRGGRRLYLWVLPERLAAPDHRTPPAHSRDSARTHLEWAPPSCRRSLAASHHPLQTAAAAPAAFRWVTKAFPWDLVEPTEATEVVFHRRRQQAFAVLQQRRSRWCCAKGT
uniref:Uncharacterized protein n=1 Tax=Haptolina ericina TaxID=156174 RepID=A0A7S3BTV6_9EUKA|mmetsp:Transcript_67822/g.151467  ORF Transcript_67822/g.151467 Transcript_67822/m.151467 type:complete len:168 (+) Transcript_67822:192-695(+)